MHIELPSALSALGRKVSGQKGDEQGNTWQEEDLCSWILVTLKYGVL